MIVVDHTLPPGKNKGDCICILQVILMHKDDAWGRGRGTRNRNIHVEL
jgi:hypothetical protein